MVSAEETSLWTMFDHKCMITQVKSFMVGVMVLSYTECLSYRQKGLGRILIWGKMPKCLNQRTLDGSAEGEIAVERGMVVADMTPAVVLVQSAKGSTVSKAT